MAYNKELKAIYDKEYRAKNLYKRRTQNLKWQKENKEAHNKSNSKYRKNNKAKVNALTAKRKAMKLKASPKWLTSDHKKHIELYYGLAHLLTKEYAISMEVDHIIPLKNDIVCGLHVPWNLQIMAKIANRDKRNRLNYE